MSKIKRFTPILAFIVTTIFALSACQQEAASTELNLLCTPQVEWCEGMKAEFEAANPEITVNFVRMSSGESLTRLRNEKDNPQFDIWWGGPIDSFIAAKDEDLLEAYDSPNLGNIKDPGLMLDPDRSQRTGQPSGGRPAQESQGRPG